MAVVSLRRRRRSGAQRSGARRGRAHGALERHGLTRSPSRGAVRSHVARSVMHDEGEANPIVGAVLRTGYALNGRVVRPAMVKVTRSEVEADAKSSERRAGKWRSSAKWFEKDYYSILEVPNEATEKEIKRAYKNLTRKLHPDQTPGTPSPREVQEVSAAYGRARRRGEAQGVRRGRQMVASGFSPGGGGASAASRAAIRSGVAALRFDVGGEGGLGDLLAASSDAAGAVVRTRPATQWAAAPVAISTRRAAHSLRGVGARCHEHPCGSPPRRPAPRVTARDRPAPLLRRARNAVVPARSRSTRAGFRFRRSPELRWPRSR